MSNPTPNNQVYTLDHPQNPLPMVFDSPHSGRNYPDDFGFSCPFSMLQKAEDNYVDDLFTAVPSYGGSLLCALFPRTYIDVNRAPDDIDPDLLTDDDTDAAAHWQHQINPTARSHAGIGLIRRILKPGFAVYDRKLRLHEIAHRIETYYKPYHAQLEHLIEERHYHFGQVWHINCHSMPQTGGFSRILSHSARSAVPDFVLGDRDGTSCELAFTHALRDFLRDLGYRVAINNPYRGVELVRRYASPSTGRHSIQIEINKGLYWDETTNQKSKNYNALKSDIEKFIEFCARYVTEQSIHMAAD